MQVSLPWILSRRRLIFAAVADGILFAFLYYVLYKLRFSVWPGFSPRLAILLVIWPLSSYVTGRYVSGAGASHVNCNLNFVYKQLTSTVAVLLLTLGITLFHIFLFNQNPAQATSRSFLIPFLGSLAVLSQFVQLAIHRFLAIQAQDRNSTWSYVGSCSGFHKLKKMLRWSRVSVRVEHVQSSLLGETLSSKFIIEQFHGLPSSVLKSLSQYQSKGYVILSRLEWCELVLQRFPSELLSEEDILAGRFYAPKGNFQSRLKHLGDVVVSSSLLIITSPLILLSALLIKCSDGGPIFYSQIRTGLNGNPFRIWKLRTMRTDAELQGAQWSSRSDPRVTRFGAMLRSTRLDELPQLWCVLTGSMSLIGPRPERPEFDQRLSQKISFYELRHLIRPGLSGWAQVNYPYGASEEDSANKLSYDLFYLKNFSFLLDLLILFKTMRLVFNAKGSLPGPSSSSNPSSLS